MNGENTLRDEADRIWKENSATIAGIAAIGQALYAVSEAGHVFRSTDHGVSWAEVLPPPQTRWGKEVQ